jgi:protein-S-isoprenylcysteine O-methyltransferase Ste14
VRPPRDDFTALELRIGGTGRYLRYNGGSQRAAGRDLAMWTFARALIYATLFISFFLVFLPARVLSRSGIPPVPQIGLWQVLGMILAAVGSAIALWCILTFVLQGKGTPAPFDPPRRLVVRGPYRFVRNPMYVGAGLALAGAALVYRSVPLLLYMGVFWVLLHALVVWYEEPTLRQTFGQEYEAYCEHAGRWWPRLSQ